MKYCYEDAKNQERKVEFIICNLYLHIQTRALERMLRCIEERSSFTGRQENVELEYLA